MRKIFTRFCILQAAYWSFFAAMPAYITAYMLAKGMGAGTLGILIAVQMGSAFAGSVFWGRFVDRKRASRRFFLIGVIAAGALSVLLYIFAGVPAVLFLLYPLFGFMNGPIATTLDSWVIAVIGRVEAGARSRTFGTLGYAVTMLVSGMLIDRFGYRFMPYIGMSLILMAVLTALCQPEVMPEQSTRVHTDASPKVLLKAPRFLLLVAAVFFTGMAIGPINNMKVLVFESVGGDVSSLGWDAFIGCLLQSVFLILAGKMKKIRAEYRLTASAVFAFLYALIVFLASSPAMIIIGTLFANVNFGLIFPTMREIVEESVDSRLRTTANSIVDVAFGSVASMIAAAWSGGVMEGAGRGPMCVICMGLEVIALIFCVAIILFGRKPARRSRALSESGKHIGKIVVSGEKDLVNPVGVWYYKQYNISGREAYVTNAVQTKH